MSAPRIVLAILVLLLATGAHAQPMPKPILPGIGGVDHRDRVDANAAPWRALGRLQANAGNLHMTCTGALVGPRQVLTAAHCLYNPRTRAYFRAPDLHFLLGYAQGTFVAHAQGTAISIGPGYDPTRGIAAVANDWAVVTLDHALGTPDRRLAFLSEPPLGGASAMIGGYSQDFVEVITADTTCRIIGFSQDAAGNRYIRHDCAATRGASGAPLLVREGKDWRIAGIEVGGSSNEIGGVASETLGVVRLLAESKVDR